ITDAGHFEEEGRVAEDKVAEKAKLEKLEPMEMVHKYTNLFHHGMRLFNCDDPSIEPTATGHIIEQINMIEKIMSEGYAYEVNGSVYFDVPKYAANYPYGKLSGRVLEDQLETTRELDGQDEKRNKADFALWKNAPPEHIMRWKSPWGEGFPGWHIECSAMSSKYLGEVFDIHGGGMDLQFPHHESEIAQSTIAHGHAPVRYWMHNNMITINGKKMGKSYNNVIKLSELFSGNHPILEQPYHPMVVRFYILQTHYRSTLDFSNEALQSAEKAARRLWDAWEIVQKIAHPGNVAATNVELDQQVNTLINECADFMNDDLNTARVIANLFELAPVINGMKGGQVAVDAVSAETFERIKKAFQTYMIDIMGMQGMQAQQSNKLDQVLSLLIEIRTDAKKRKDFATSDQIRNRLAEAGVLLKDEKDGTVSWTVE
ncbi:MAG: cysteine--tRNA ligase, partial [Chitinophagia bacterium]|nr:cysteine--tRNA ligase [Chitinophagia bacterium]